MLAIARGSFKSILRSPSSVAFSLGFPLIFILGFVFLDNNNHYRIPLGFSNAQDTTTAVYQKLGNIAGIELITGSEDKLTQLFKRNRLTASVHINKDSSITLSAPSYVKQGDVQVLQNLLQNSFATGAQQYSYVINEKVNTIEGRQYKVIDFILPGQLGFALLGASVFGVAFLFFNLRQQLVLKRFFATPVSRTNILLGETLSRTVFQLIAATIVIVAGVLFFDFTLIYGFWTYLQIMILCVIALVVFMGCGFLVSGIANSSAAVPSLANIFTLPQFILAGTFFPIDNFPPWLQKICNVLPLTHFNDAMRSICFDGASLADRWFNVLVILIWGVIIYALAVRFFRWE